MADVKAELLAALEAVRGGAPVAGRLPSAGLFAEPAPLTAGHQAGVDNLIFVRHANAAPPGGKAKARDRPALLPITTPRCP